MTTYSDNINGVYPRVCGGSPQPHLVVMLGQGLSPRVRGKQADTDERCVYPGSIPACAGEALVHASYIKSYRVYPRVCGGSSTATAQQDNEEGLSPRVRGKQSPTDLPQIAKRSIPACAGEAVRGGRRRLVSAVYPRVCGGSQRVCERLSTCSGLSPRVRGKPYTVGGDSVGRGSIPACAGEARSSSAVVSVKTVYPRVCGGSSIGRKKGSSISGLSPRVRGKRGGVPHPQAYRRSIPACAGEALSDLYLFPPLLRSYRLIVLHQVDPVSIDYLLRLLSQYPDPLASHR